MELSFRDYDTLVWKVFLVRSVRVVPQRPTRDDVGPRDLSDETQRPNVESSATSCDVSRENSSRDLAMSPRDLFDDSCPCTLRDKGLGTCVWKESPCGVKRLSYVPQEQWLFTAIGSRWRSYHCIIASRECFMCAWRDVTSRRICFRLESPHRAIVWLTLYLVCSNHLSPRELNANQENDDGK